MVESLFSCLSFIREEGDLIIAYGDIVYQSNNLQALLDCDDEIALMIDRKWKDLWSLRLGNPLDDAETLMMDSAGYITELGRKPQSYDQIEGQYTGLIKIRSEKLAELEEFYSQLDRSATYDGEDFKNMYMTFYRAQPSAHIYIENLHSSANSYDWNILIQGFTYYCQFKSIALGSGIFGRRTKTSNGVAAAERRPVCQSVCNHPAIQ